MLDRGSDMHSGTLRTFILGANCVSLFLTSPTASRIRCGSLSTCSPSVTAADLAQAFDRAHRFGQSEDVEIYKLSITGVRRLP